MGVLFLDLDRFKEVNDVLGHEVGDQLLVAVAATLRETVHRADSVGRLGGDEFLVVLEDFSHIQVAALAASRISNAFARVFPLGPKEVRTQASIGIAICPDDGEDTGTLMRQADLAMYKAKESGGATWVLFSRELSERLEARLAMESALAAAVENGELFLVYQPRFADGRKGGRGRHLHRRPVASLRRGRSGQRSKRRR